MRSILQILNTLQQYTGNTQLAMLSQYKTNNLLKQVLEYTYDPHRKYKIEDGGKYRKFSFFHNEEELKELTVNDWAEYKTKLDRLAELKSAKDDDTRDIVCFIKRYTEEDQKFLEQVLFKDLRLNMGIKKFQKVWPDFLVEPHVQLAVAKEDRPAFYESYYSRKFDGKRQWIQDKVPYSRSNKLCSIQPIKHILEQLDLLPDFVNDYVLDGECLYFENGQEDFQKGISLCQSDNRQEDCDNICYVIFDMIPKQNFKTKTPFKCFKEEYEILKKLTNEEKPTPCYSLLPTNAPNIFVARQDTDTEKLAPLMVKNHWEGLMLRDGNSPYEYKRTNKLLKIKQMHDTEVLLTSMEEGTGKYQNKLGAFHALYEGYDLKIGSGFSDEQRDYYWNNQDKFLNKYIKVQYFEKTQNQKGELSLRFPVFLCFRDTDTQEEFLK